jgi:ubiquinone/menaquinone biosynthesis C-methylase UbiE/uncharacterized protein YbaR (Trm112 family)
VNALEPHNSSTVDQRSALQYCCPLCKGELESSPESYRCASCKRDFPIVWGIPDFRVFPDPYISIPDDHAKGLKLAARYETENVEALMRYYWSMTPDTPDQLATRYIRYDLAGVERGRAILREVEPHLAAKQRVLEVGCRTGGFLVAAGEQFPQVVGIDIAFRWLVVAKRWLADQGRSAQLVCCCAQFLPFRANQFDLVVAGNVIEHTMDQQPVVSEAHRVLSPAGVFFAATCNRFSIGREPHVRVWGVGWLPRAWMNGYVRAIRGVPYENVRLVSLLGLRQLVRKAGFDAAQIAPPKFSPGEQRGLSARERAVLTIYNTVSTWIGVKQVLLLIGPLFQVIARKNAVSKGGAA